MSDALWKWESIDRNTDRMRVPSGWIIRTSVIGISHAGIHHVFVPDAAQASKELDQRHVTPDPNVQTLKNV